MKKLNLNSISDFKGGCTQTTPVFIKIIDFIAGAPILNGLTVAADQPSVWSDCP